MRAAWVGIALVLLSACGPTAAEIRRARSARYSRCSYDEVLKVVKRTVKARYASSWINAHDAVGSYYFLVADPHSRRRSRTKPYYVLRLRVSVQPAAEGGYAIVTRPDVFHHQPQSRGKRVERLPSWATEEIDELYVVIHERLAHCEAAR